MPRPPRASAIEGMDSFDTWTLIAAPLLGVAMVLATLIATLLSA